MQGERVGSWTAAISLLVIAAIGGDARAQNAEAEALFRDGDRLLDAGEIAAACDSFEASNRVEPRAGTLIRLADCREKNGQLASAWSAYSDALSRVKDPKKREIAQAKVSGLEPRLSYLTINVSDESRIAGLVITRNGQTVDASFWNRGAPVDGGEYVIAGRAPGHEEWSTKVTVKPEADKVAVEVPKFKELKVLTTPPLGRGDVVDDDDGPTGPIDEPSALTPRRKIALGVAGVSVVALVGGAILGTQAKGLEQEAHDACTMVICVDYAEANQALDDARSKARLANIGYGVAIAAGAGAAVLWLTGGPKHDDGLAIAPQIAPGLAGALVQGRF
jgi:tetratricopeptide (TPR) repeat protein